MTEKILIAFAVLVLALNAFGCGAAGDGTKITKLSPQHSNLLTSLESKGNPSFKAILQRGTVVYEGEPLANNTVRVAEIDNLCKGLEERLGETYLFSSVEYTGLFDAIPQLQDNEILLVLSCEEDYSYDRWANATTAGLTGFFTLGVAPATLKHGYDSKMTIDLHWNRQQHKQYESFTEVEVSVLAYQNQFHSQGIVAVERARHQVAENNVSFLIHQMILDKGFFLAEIEK